jgi:hypothetical protein
MLVRGQQCAVESGLVANCASCDGLQISAKLFGE